MSDFQYNIRSSDADKLQVSTADVLDMKDRQLELMLNGALTGDRVRFGSWVGPLPSYSSATGATITYDRPFPSSFTQFIIIVSNGHYSANPARIEVADPAFNTPTSFRIRHGKSANFIGSSLVGSGTSQLSYETGNTGSNVRVNYLSIAIW